jgi:transposase-like protein
LTPKQKQAIDALLVTPELGVVAQKIGVNRSTLYRWLHQPAFVHALRAAEADAVEELSRLLVRLGRTAISTLAKAMTDPATPATTKVRAADATLSRLLQLRELASLEQRLTALEQAAGREQDTQ